MGILRLREGRPDEAIRHLMIAKKDKSLEVRAWLYLGIAYKQKGWPERAAVALRKVTFAAPKNVTPYLHLIELFSRKGDYARTRKVAHQVADLMARNEDLSRAVIDLMETKEKAEDSFLAPDYVLPAIASALKEKHETWQQWKAATKKTMEKEMQIR
jgi:predicted Zn-dependent protease